MYGRIYTVRLTPTAVSAALDALEIAPAANKSVVLRKVVLTVTDSEVNKQVQVTIRTLPATLTSGSTGAAAPTVAPTATSNAAAGFTAENFNTSRATTTGTAQYHCDEGFPTQGGFEYLPDVDERPIAVNGQAFIVGIEETMDGATVGGYAVVEEIG